MKQFFFFLIAIITISPAFSQDQQQGQRRWGNQQHQVWQRNGFGQQQAPNRSGQFSAAEYWRQQKEFFTQKANLTEDEANAFFPVYNELQQKKRDLNREIRHLSFDDGQPKTEEQAAQDLEAIANVNIKIAELEKEYLQKFKQVLPASKILKVQNAEEEFNSQILKDIQQSRGHQFQQGQQRPVVQPQRPGQPQFNRPGQNN